MILFTIAQKIKEILKYKSNKKCTRSVCYKLQNDDQRNKRKPK